MTLPVDLSISVVGECCALARHLAHVRSDARDRLLGAPLDERDAAGGVVAGDGDLAYTDVASIAQHTWHSAAYT